MRRQGQELMRQAKAARGRADAQRTVAAEVRRKVAEQALALESKDKLNRMMSQWKSDANVAKAVELGDTSLIKKKKVRTGCALCPMTILILHSWPHPDSSR